MNKELAKLADEYWEDLLARRPTQALLQGDHRYDDRVEDLTRDAEDDAIATLEAFVARASEIDAAALTADERVTLAVLVEEAGGEAAELRSRLAEFAVDPSMGLHVVLLQMVGHFPLTDPDHADAVVSKFERVADMFDQAAQRLREGLKSARTPPRVSVEKSISQIDAYLASPLDADPFVNIPAPPGMDDEAVEVWRDRLEDAVVGGARAGYERYRDVLVAEVLEHSRPPERTGVSWLADGDEIYAGAVQRHTSLDLDPGDVHQIGLDITEQLGDEYRELGSKVLGTADLDEIFTRLRNDETLRFESPDEIISAAKGAMERAAAAIPRWFGRQPRTECVMATIPGPGAEEAPLAYYLPPAPDGSRPGTFFVNTTEPTTRTRYESEALAFHESIPGHHLQIAIAQELEGIPEFRKHALLNAYVEGWGLYSERLADEMGLYSSDVARLGMLSFDSWRAGRLVVDTGMHALGWSRDRAIDWMTTNTPQAPNNIETEIDRYIGWPGQALGYMIGRREIVRLRRDAEQRLGTGFDISKFHDTVLGSGPVPLEMLGRLVEDWIAAEPG